MVMEVPGHSFQVVMVRHKIQVLMVGHKIQVVKGHQA
jgi:hypothetical protein